MANPSITNVENTSVCTGENLFETGTIASGQMIAAGQMLGVITLTGEFAILDSAATDGTQFARAVSPIAVDATGGAVSTKVCVKGFLDESLLIFDGSDTLDTVPSGTTDSYLWQLRDFGMYPTPYDNIYTEDNQ